MLSKSNKALKNICAVFLVMSLMVLSFIPAFAEAEPMPLSEENVVEYPTATGEIYYTQKIGDCLTLEGGKVTVDGTAEGEEIAGHWEFVNPEEVPAKVSSSAYSAIKFLPEDNVAYSEFEVSKPSKPARFNIKKAPMEFANPDILPTSSEVEENSQLQDSSIVGVDLKCSITGANVADFTTPKWKWEVRSFVTQSGWYQAKVTATGFYDLQFYIYVRVKGDTSEPLIKEMPTIEPIEYYDGLKAGDLQPLLESGGGEATVPGHFEISEPSQELSAGVNQVGIVFKPNDSLKEDEQGYILVTVNKATASFIDENGEPIIPEVKFLATQEVFEGTDIINQLKKFDANCGKAGEMVFGGNRYSFTIPQAFTRLSAGDNSGSNSWKIPEDFDANGYVCSVALTSNYNTNYTNVLKFKIVQVKKLVTPQISWFKDEMTIRGLVYTDYPAGTFKVYANGELIESTKDGVKYLTSFAWRPAKSGTYTIKAEYTPAENDKVAIENNVIEQDVTANLSWTVNGENVNFTSTTKQYGTNVTVLQSLGDNFGGWEFYDENGNKYADPEKELGMRYDPTVPSTVNFTMPDHDVTVKAIDKTQVNLPGGDSKLPDFFSKIINWINNLITKIKALFDAIIQSLMLIG